MRRAKKARRHETDQKGVRELARQYVSIAEAENQPRAAFSGEIYNRAFDAVTYRPENASLEELLTNHSSLAPDWSKLREDASTYIELAVEEVAGRLK